MAKTWYHGPEPDWIEHIAWVWCLILRYQVKEPGLYSTTMHWRHTRYQLAVPVTEWEVWNLLQCADSKFVCKVGDKIVPLSPAFEVRNGRILALCECLCIGETSFNHIGAKLFQYDPTNQPWQHPNQWKIQQGHSLTSCGCKWWLLDQLNGAMEDSIWICVSRNHHEIIYSWLDWALHEETSCVGNGTCQQTWLFDPLWPDVVAAVPIDWCMVC